MVWAALALWHWEVILPIARYGLVGLWVDFSYDAIKLRNGQVSLLLRDKAIAVIASWITLGASLELARWSFVRCEIIDRVWEPKELVPAKLG